MLRHERDQAHPRPAPARRDHPPGPHARSPGADGPHDRRLRGAAGGMAAGGPPVDPTVPAAGPLGELPLAPVGRPAAAGRADDRADRPHRPDAARRRGGRGATTPRAAPASSSGPAVVEPPPPHGTWTGTTSAAAAHRGVGLPRASTPSGRERYRPAIAEFVEAAEHFTDAGAYLAAQQRRAARRRRVGATGLPGRRSTCVLEPTLPIVPYGRGPGYDRGHAGGPGDPMIALTALWDMTGMPVAALPVTWEAGISLVAPRGHEARLIRGHRPAGERTPRPALGPRRRRTATGMRESAQSHRTVRRRDDRGDPVGAAGRPAPEHRDRPLHGVRGAPLRPATSRATTTCGDGRSRISRASGARSGTSSSCARTPRSSGCWRRARCRARCGSRARGSTTPSTWSAATRTPTRWR